MSDASSSSLSETAPEVPPDEIRLAIRKLEVAVIHGHVPTVASAERSLESLIASALAASRSEGQQDRTFEQRVGEFALAGRLAVNPSRKVAFIYGKNDEKVIDACGDTIGAAIRIAFAEWNIAVAQPDSRAYVFTCGAHGCGESAEFPNDTAASLAGWFLDETDGYGWICPKCAPPAAVAQPETET